MSNKTPLKSISKITRKLLSKGESVRSDFKTAPKGVKENDFVSFANTDIGGIILVGVKEDSGHNGEQIGTVTGCDVSDGAILEITNRALSCIPPVAIDVHIENVSDRPFLRIEIPPSQTKPHCTPGGVYCRRDGRRNRPLQPDELLQIFLEREAQSFAKKFEAAADRITEDLNQLEDSLAQNIRSMGDQLGWAEFKLDDTESTLHSILGYAQQTKVETDDISDRLRELYRQDKRDDPVRNRIRKNLLNKVVEQISNDPKLLEYVSRVKSVQINASGKEAKELNKDDLAEIVREAINVVQTASDGSDTDGD